MAFKLSPPIWLPGLPSSTLLISWATCTHRDISQLQASSEQVLKHTVSCTTSIVLMSWTARNCAWKRFANLGGAVMGAACRALCVILA